MINKVDDNGKIVLVLDESDIWHIVRKHFEGKLNVDRKIVRFNGVEHMPLEIRTMKERELVAPSLLKMNVTVTIA